jgi:hypothetical protein
MVKMKKTDFFFFWKLDNVEDLLIESLKNVFQQQTWTIMMKTYLQKTLVTWHGSNNDHDQQNQLVEGWK